MIFLTSLQKSLNQSISLSTFFGYQWDNSRSSTCHQRGTHYQKMVFYFIWILCVDFESNRLNIIDEFYNTKSRFSIINITFYNITNRMGSPFGVLMTHFPYICGTVSTISIVSLPWSIIRAKSSILTFGNVPGCFIIATYYHLTTSIPLVINTE